MDKAPHCAHHGATMGEQLPAIEAALFRRVLGHYPTGVCVVTAVDAAGRRAGMVVGSFTSVSLDPPLVGFFPDRVSTSWPRIRDSGRFCVNILAADQQAMCRRFAAKAEDKFIGVDFRLSPLGMPVLPDVVAWIECSLHAVHEAGDHFIALGRVLDLGVDRAERPMLFFRGSYGDFAPLDETLPG